MNFAENPVPKVGFPGMPLCAGSPESGNRHSRAPGEKEKEGRNVSYPGPFSGVRFRSVAAAVAASGGLQRLPARLAQGSHHLLGREDLVAPELLEVPRRLDGQPAASAVPSSGSSLMENPWYSWPPPMW